MKATPAVIKQFGGKFLVRGGDLEIFKGGWNLKRLVVVEFVSVSMLRPKEFYNSPEYRVIMIYAKVRYTLNGKRPHFSSEELEAYQKSCSNVYTRERTPLARHSIGHKTNLLGAGMSMPVLDPSTFHGYTDSLQPYIDGFRCIGKETVADELCDVIEVSIMKGQRSRYLWLARSDHLPRKLKQVVRVSYDIVTHEHWSDVVLDVVVPAERFVWQPPKDWKRWYRPSLEKRLLKPGQQAPDFTFPLVDGKTFKLSDHRDEIVWLYIWRAG